MSDEVEEREEEERPQAEWCRGSRSDPPCCSCNVKKASGTEIFVKIGWDEKYLCLACGAALRDQLIDATQVGK